MAEQPFRPPSRLPSMRFDISSIASVCVHIFLPAAALVSTKSILTGQNFHFRAYQALHLLLAQLLPTCAFLAFSRRSFLLGLCITCRSRSAAGWLDWIGRSWRRAMGALCLAMALPLYSQTLLHLSNFSTVAIVTGLISLAVHPILAAIRSAQGRLIACLLVAFTVYALCVVLWDDYRLTVNGLVFALLCSILYLVGIVLIAYGPRQALQFTSIGLSARQNIYQTALFASTIITAIVTIWMEPGIKLRDMLNVHPVLFIFNIVSVVLTLLVKVAHEHESDPKRHGCPHFGHDIAIQSLLFIGTACLLCDNLGMPGYLTLPQAGAYLSTHAAALWASRALSGYDFSSNSGKASLLAGHLNPRTEAAAYDQIELQPFNADDGDSDDSGNEQDIEEPLGPAQECQTDEDSKSRFFNSSLIASLISAGVIWIALLTMNTYLFSVDEGRMVPSLDLKYIAPSDMDIVISMYKEDVVSVAATIKELQNLLDQKGRSARTIVYVKDEDVDPVDMKAKLEASKVVIRPNIGREGETYLYHIVNEFDRLAGHTLFIQAHTHNLWEVSRRIESYFQEDTGALSLGFSGNTCLCTGCSDRWGWDDVATIASWYEKVYRRKCSEVLLSYKGQFIASAKRIRGLSIDIYRELHTAITDSGSWAHSEPYLDGRPDSLNAPYFGYTLERMWSILLQCSEPEIALKCPTLLAGERRGGRSDDCQCLDTV